MGIQAYIAYNLRKFNMGPELPPRADLQPTRSEVAAARKAIDLNRSGLHLEDTTRYACGNCGEVDPIPGCCSSPDVMPFDSIPCVHGVTSNCIDCNPGRSLSETLKGVDLEATDEIWLNAR